VRWGRKLEPSFDVLAKLFDFLGHLSLEDRLKLAATIGFPALGGAFLVYKHGKSAALDVEKNLRARADRLATDLTSTQTELDRLKPSAERLQERVQELTTELIATRGARQAGDATGLIDGLRQRVDKFDKLKNALLGSEDEVWKLRDAVPPVDFERRMAASRVNVLTVGNLKGGVGKTTMTANLAAHFALARRKRVLLIDFDYQGSLTRMMVLGAQLALGQAILADTLLAGDAKGTWLAQAPRELGARVGHVRFITCGPTFDGFENRALLRWLIGEIDDDVRYRLANLILSDAVQAEFDLVIIDAPPRLSLGTVNALCASHGLLLPTVPDALSVDATNRFLQRANLFRSINPALRNIGVIVSMSELDKLKPYETAAIGDARLALAHWNGLPGVIFNRNIRHFSSLAQAAGKQIGYVEDAKVRSVFDQLGSEISNT
jgi:cellulose biosynthesis protein BcsQ